MATIRFEALCTRDALLEGWKRVFTNGGGPGGDGVSIHDFGAGLDTEIDRLVTDLAGGLYRPGPMRRRSVPKRSGGLRPLSIPSVRDRVVQAALHALLAPLLDAEFEDGSFGYRIGRGVREAVRRVSDLRSEGYTHVIDADIKRFFESVPHAALMQRFAQSVQDSRLTELVALWLAAAEPDGRGLPQGSPISPLLSNLYLDALDEALAGRGVRIVRFADDFVVLCKSAPLAEETLSRVVEALASLGLELNQEKSRLIDFDRGFRFLGHLFVRSLVLASPARDEPPGLDQLPPDEAPPASPAAPDPRLPEPIARRESAAVQAPSPASSGVLPPATVAPHDEQAPDGEPGPDGSGRPAPIVRPLYIYQPGNRLTLHGESFAVRDPEGALLLAWPPRRVGRIEIGPEAEADADALRQAVLWGIPVALTSAGGATQGLLSAPPARNGRRHMAQAGAWIDEARRTRLARAFVEGRLRNQRALLRRLNRRRRLDRVAAAAAAMATDIAALDKAADVDALRGYEGAATARYWPALGACLEHGFGLGTRERAPPDGPVNLMLSFAASMLTRDTLTLVLRHGLHAGIGYLHAPHDQPGPCAYDLVEAFRAPLAEGFVVYAFNNRILLSGHFGRREDETWFVTPDGRDRFVRAYEAWMNRPVRSLRSGTDRVWRGLIEEDVMALVDAVENDRPFVPYRMDH